MKKGFRTFVTAALLGAMGWIATGCETAPITGRSQMILLSDAQATQMGVEAYQQIMSKAKPSTNQSYINRVRTIGQRIAAVSGQPDLKWEFNAQCLRPARRQGGGPYRSVHRRQGRQPACRRHGA